MAPVFQSFVRFCQIQMLGDMDKSKLCYNGVLKPWVQVFVEGYRLRCVVLKPITGRKMLQEIAADHVVQPNQLNHVEKKPHQVGRGLLSMTTERW